MCMNSLKGEVWVSDNDFLATGSTYHHVEYLSTERVCRKKKNTHYFCLDYKLSQTRFQPEKGGHKISPPTEELLEFHSFLTKGVTFL